MPKGNALSRLLRLIQNEEKTAADRTEEAIRLASRKKTDLVLYDYASQAKALTTVIDKAEKTLCISFSNGSIFERIWHKGDITSAIYRAVQERKVLCSIIIGADEITHYDSGTAGGWFYAAMEKQCVLRPRVKLRLPASIVADRHSAFALLPSGEALIYFNNPKSKIISFCLTCHFSLLEEKEQVAA